MAPVTYGKVSGSTSIPSSALATPAWSVPAIRSTSARAPRAPWPTRTATFFPAHSTSAARSSACSVGSACQPPVPRLEGTILNSWPGGSYSSSCTSAGMITAVGALRAQAVRIARSSTLGSCSGTVTVSRNSEATSLNRECRSTSC